ncbi:hypothetical protein RHA1_ro07224 [Rhodococcus jostii RHA1]|uniref:Uncharacterized protein n=1 Tax=Rhodococcus jostii (strain RHA1) TaxID=101510 RepID=Q0S0E8_RHOJR|nr:hypothetical protein RHA1_ro07224 [Rhodococcus jostii RHA1]
MVNANCRGTVDPGPVMPGPIHERRAPSQSETTRDRPPCSPSRRLPRRGRFVQEWCVDRRVDPSARRRRPTAGGDSVSTAAQRTDRTTMPAPP